MKGQGRGIYYVNTMVVVVSGMAARVKNENEGAWKKMAKKG